MSGIFFEITIIICLAAVLSIVLRFLKQPPILAYILTGIIIGPFGQLQLQNGPELRMMAQFGITLLLFMLGLEFKLKDLKSISKTAISIGIPQILLSGLGGYAISIWLGFSTIVSLYLAVAMSFSSTIIIVKLLSNKKDLHSLYGKIAVGILLLQDLCAVFVLMFLSMFVGQQEIFVDSVLIMLLKAALLFGLVIFLSKYVFPNLLDKLAKSEETLLLFSLGWALGLSVLVSSPIFGFSIEIAGFLAGVALANTSENFQIISRVRALQDFFIIIFFVVLGIETTSGDMGQLGGAAIALFLFVVLGKPLLTMLSMGILGYRKRTGFFTSTHLGQVSEFSFIILLLGNKLGHVNGSVVSLFTIVGLASFAFSTYVSLYANTIYKFVKDYLRIFEFGKIREIITEASDEDLGNLSGHVALIGANRMGESILDALLEEEERVIVVDFDPDIVRELKDRGVMSVFGDIADSDIQERVRLKSAKLVISTVSDYEDNLLLLDAMHRNKNNAKVVVVAQDFTQAKRMYDAGADYVVLPHVIGGKHLAKMIKEDTLDKIDSKKASRHLDKHS